MHFQLTRPSKYRHVVFTGPTGSTARIVNLAPQPSTRADGSLGTSELTDEEDAFLRSVFACAGLDANAYRPESLRRRLQACLRAVRATSILDARRMLAKQPSLVPVAINAMVIGVTSFFRDAPVYDEKSWPARWRSSANSRCR